MAERRLELEENPGGFLPEFRNPFSNTRPLQRSINESLNFTRNNKPNYQLGATKSTNHLIYEMNEFYLEMNKKIEELNLRKCIDLVNDVEDLKAEDTGSVLYDVMSVINKRRNDPVIKKQIESLLTLDQQLEKTYKMLHEERQERQEIQDKLCAVIDEFDAPNSQSRLFKQLCEIENSNSKSSKIKQLEKENLLEEERQKTLKSKAADDENNKDKPKAEMKDDKFVKRNIQLAKNTSSMFKAGNTLTDEEKVQLNDLLTDLDGLIDEKDIPTEDVAQSTPDKSEEINISTSGVFAYSISDDDMSKLEELESKLKKITDNIYETSKIQNEFESNVEKNKTWMNEDRLKEINARLDKLRVDRESFIHQPTETPEFPQVQENDVLETSTDDENDESTCDLKSISLDTLTQRSQSMLDTMEHLIMKIENNHQFTDTEDLNVESVIDYDQTATDDTD